MRDFARDNLMKRRYLFRILEWVMWFWECWVMKSVRPASDEEVGEDTAVEYRDYANRYIFCPGVGC